MFMKVLVSSIAEKKETDMNEDLLDGSEIIQVQYSINPNPKKEPNQFRDSVLNPNLQRQCLTLICKGMLNPNQ